MTLYIAEAEFDTFTCILGIFRRQDDAQRACERADKRITVGARHALVHLCVQETILDEAADLDRFNNFVGGTFRQEAS